MRVLSHAAGLWSDWLIVPSQADFLKARVYSLMAGAGFSLLRQRHRSWSQKPGMGQGDGGKDSGDDGEREGEQDAELLIEADLPEVRSRDAIREEELKTEEAR